MLVDFRAHLLADLAGYVGSRIYPEEIPQGSTFPALVYSVVSEQRTPTMDGPDTLPSKRIQIDAWAKSFAAAWQIAEAVRVSLDGFRGDMGDTYIGGIFANSINPAGPDPETTLKRVSRDYIVWHSE